MQVMPAPKRESTLRDGDERAQLDSFLDFFRETLIAKCEGLDLEQLVRRPVESSDLTLLGLVRHMTAVEQWWFEHVFAAIASPPYYDSAHDDDADFHDLRTTPLEQVFANYDAACARSREIAEGVGLETLAATSGPRGVANLRWIYVHMIEEYARHCGHADLLREMIDGSTGY
jgi:hypothetical protein